MGVMILRENILGKRMRSLREKKDLKQNRVAESLGVSSFQLSRYESGKTKPDPELIAKISSYYNVTTDYLLGTSDHPRLSEQQDREADKEIQEWKKLLDQMPEPKRSRMKERIMDYMRGVSDSEKD